MTVHLAEAVGGADVESLTCTREHPVYVEGKGFVRVGALAIGNAIVTRAGPDLCVSAVEWHSQPGGYQVYNLVVADDHSYFVGNSHEGAWVHNGTGPCGGQLTLPFDDLPAPTEKFQWHHPWPKYLGGAADQPLVRIPDWYHQQIHRALDVIYPRSAGTSAFVGADPSEVAGVLSRIYNQYPLTMHPVTGVPFEWR